MSVRRPDVVEETTGHVKQPASLPPFIREAVEEQQQRVHALSALIECYREAIESGNCSDTIAAGNGLVDLADSIVLALDQQVVAERAQEIEIEKEWQQERESAETQS